MSPHCSSADVEPQGKWKGLPAVFLSVATNVAATHTAAKIEVWEPVKHEFISTHTHFPDVCSCWSHWGKWHLPHTRTHTPTSCAHMQWTLCSASLRDPPSEPVMTAESHLPQGPSPFPEGPTPNGHLIWQACLLISMLKNHLNFRAFCGSARAFTETTSPHHFSFNLSLPKDWSLTNVLYGNLHLSLHSREQNHILHKKTGRKDSTILFDLSFYQG